MANTYSTFSDICTKFYDLVVDPVEVAEFVYSRLKSFQPQSCLFVGGFFLVASELQKRGLDIVLSDYSEDMIVEARARMPATKTVVADLRSLPFDSKFDSVLVIGRVFTHMLTSEDASNALRSIYSSLKPGGVVLLDNYEDSKIRRTDYFNGRIAVKDPSISIVRDSTTELVSEVPYVVNWKADYRIQSNGKSMTFEDQMPHRAFSRAEMRELFELHRFEVNSQGDNFDETSFYTVAIRK